jgi:hypothetical protein
VLLRTKNRSKHGDVMKIRNEEKDRLLEDMDRYIQEQNLRAEIEAADKPAKVEIHYLDNGDFFTIEG